MCCWPVILRLALRSIERRSLALGIAGPPRAGYLGNLLEHISNLSVGSFEGYERCGAAGQGLASVLAFCSVRVGCGHRREQRREAGR